MQDSLDSRGSSADQDSIRRPTRATVGQLEIAKPWFSSSSLSESLARLLLLTPSIVDIAYSIRIKDRNQEGYHRTYRWGKPLERDQAV